MLVGSELTPLAADAEIDKKSEVLNMLGIAIVPNIIVTAIAIAIAFFVVVFVLKLVFIGIFLSFYNLPYA